MKTKGKNWIKETVGKVAVFMAALFVVGSCAGSTDVRAAENNIYETDKDIHLTSETTLISGSYFNKALKSLGHVTEDTTEESSGEGEPSNPEESEIDNTIEDTVTEICFVDTPFTSDVRLDKEGVPVYARLNGTVIELYTKADTIYVNTNAIGMFSGFIAVKTIDTARLNTSKTTCMKYVFTNCRSLESIDVGDWDTSNVWDFYNTFGACHSLKVVNTRNWDVSHATRLARMFAGSGVTHPEVSEWDVSNCSNFEGMFSNSKFEGADLSKWDMSNATNIQFMFNGSTVKEMDLSAWRATKVIYMRMLFYKCQQLKSVDISCFDITNMKNYDKLFVKNNVLETITLPVIPKGKSMTLPSVGNLLTYPNFIIDDNNNGVSEDGIGYHKDKVLTDGKAHTYIKANAYKVYDSTDSKNYLENDLYGISGKKIVISDELRSSYVYDGEVAFYDKDGNELKEFPESGEGIFMASETTLTTGMKFNKIIMDAFGGDFTKEIDGKRSEGTITNFRISAKPFTSNVRVDDGEGIPVYARLKTGSEQPTIELYSKAKTIYFNPDCSLMFSHFRALHSLWLADDISTSKVTDMTDMFSYDRSLSDIPGVSTWDTSNVVKAGWLFGNSGIYQVDLSGWNTSKMKDIHAMFTGCKGLESLDVSMWDVSNVTQMDNFISLYKPELSDLREVKLFPVSKHQEVLVFYGDDNVFFGLCDNSYGVSDDDVEYRGYVKEDGKAHRYMPMGKITVLVDGEPMMLPRTEIDGKVYDVNGKAFDYKDVMRTVKDFNEAKNNGTAMDLYSHKLTILSPTKDIKVFDTVKCEATHVYEWVIDEEPTCKTSTTVDGPGKPGSKHQVCTLCGKEGERGEIPGVPHHLKEVMEDHEDPTCTKNGTTHLVCETCGTHYWDHPAATGHSYEHSYKDATCDEDGYDREVCSRCGDIESETIIPALGHKKHWVTDEEPTCSKEGHKHEECDNCDKRFNENTPIEKLEHIYEWVHDTEGTCTQDGIRHKECTLCHAKADENSVYKKAQGHVGIWVVDKEATCTETGLKHHECKVCGAVYDENTVIEKLNHKYKWHIDTAATCTEPGVRHKECSVCHAVDSESKEYISALGHVTRTITIDASCETDGVIKEVCYACDTVLSETIIPAKGHEKKERKVAATCDTDGYIKEVCAHCGELLSETTIPATGHVPKWIVDREATCTKVGIKHQECENCGQHIGDNVFIDKLPHDFKMIEDGKKTYEECTVCHTRRNEKVINTGECEHVEKVIKTSPTCTEAGLEKTVCSLCGKVLSEKTLAATGHDMHWVTDSKATCDKEGYKHQECKNCGLKTDENTVIEKKEHNFEWKVDTEATCENIGVRHEECTECGLVRSANTEYGEIREHKYEEYTTPATHHSNGESYKRCSYCGKKIDEEVIPAIEHEWEKVYVSPTLSTGGYYKYVCSCGDVKKDDGGKEIREYVTDSIQIVEPNRSGSTTSSSESVNGNSETITTTTTAEAGHKTDMPLPEHMALYSNGVPEVSCKEDYETASEPVSRYSPDMFYEDDKLPYDDGSIDRSKKKEKTFSHSNVTAPSGNIKLPYDDGWEVSKYALIIYGCIFVILLILALLALHIYREAAAREFENDDEE